MTTPGPRNSVTDIAGLAVGNAHDAKARSGVTVLLPDRPVLTAVDVRGGSPFTVNTQTFDSGTIVETLHGLVLSGGSAFGLDAAGGLTSWLAVRGRGTMLDGCCIPTVTGAILYDLANGGDKAWGEQPPYRALAAEAAAAAGPEFALGNAGAGRVGNYSHCSFSVRGTGRFTPLTGATPHIGSVGTPEQVEEEQVQVDVDEADLEQVLAALRAAHPYEEIGYDIYERVDM